MPPRVNAKTIEFDRPGAGASGYNVTNDNVIDRLATLYRERGQKQGGSKQMYQAVLDWANNAPGRDMRPDNGRELVRAMQTGDFSRVNPAYATRALDYAFRETGRAQQHKGGSFFTNLLKDFIGPAIGYAAGTFIPGAQVLGPTLLATTGGAIQGGVEDGPLGALTGGLKGYGLASGIDAVRGWTGTMGGAPIVDGVDPSRVIPGPAAGTPGYLSPTAAGAGSAVRAGVLSGTAASGAGSVLDRVLDNAPLALGAAALLGGAKGGGGGGFDPGAAEDDRQRNRDRGIADVDRAFAKQDRYYDRLRRNVYNYQTRNLDRDYGDQSRELKFELARRGHLGGSQDVDARGDLRELYNEGRLNAGTVADQAVRNAQYADQAVRANAMRDIHLDVDSSQAVGNAIEQSRVARDQAADYARGQDLGDVFNKFAYLYTTGANRNARQRAARDYYGTPSVGVGAASSYQGT